MFNAAGQDEQAVATGLELGANMIVTPEQGKLLLPKNGVAKIKVMLQDNDKVDEKSLKFGLCEIAAGKIAPFGQSNPATIDLGKVKLPANSSIYVEAKDVSGNHQILCVPVVVK